MNEPMTYPVGWLAAYKSRKLRNEWRYMMYQVRAHNWRAVRNTFNGWLCEHDDHPHNAGSGWTKRAAQRRAARLCERAR
jgi:hypothetical protein